MAKKRTKAQKKLTKVRVQQQAVITDVKSPVKKIYVE
jgi:hypothetical protein